MTSWPPRRVLPWAVSGVSVGALLLGATWVVVWGPAQAAALTQQQHAHQAEGEAIAQACVHELRRRYGISPSLSHAKADTWTWKLSQSNGVRTWTMDGTMWFGQQLAAFDCEGTQAPDGELKVLNAFGTPWWTMPPE
ncbi:hypothetical protein [Deinococcus navajonensis]|uniref:Uncharacterized protein n=1 Tax=Deinococcus navajonensis TaxID=309884 RepID=A0ABV8XGY7_9DEIO